MTEPATTTHDLRVNGTTLHVVEAGRGPAVLLAHGFPHTHRLWSAVLPDLAAAHRVIALDLRGLGDSARPRGGYDVTTVAADYAAVLDALDEPAADVVAIDLGAPPAIVLALTRPQRVRRLVVMESLAGRLAGAEDFLAAGPPWWFGFHATPGLAETVLAGHEADYLDFFYDAGTLGRGIPRPIHDEFIAAYTGRSSLRAAFAYYRAMAGDAATIAELAGTHRLTVPTMAIGAHPVGDALSCQLRPLADDLVGHVIEDCGHIIPLDRPDALLQLLRPFVTREVAT